MYFFRYIRKTVLFFFCIAAAYSLPAQTHRFQFFPINEVALQQQAFVGKLGGHFLMLNQAGSFDLSLYVYDTVTLTATAHSYSFPKQLQAVIIHEKSIVFVASTPDKNGVRYHFMEIDEEGNIIRRKDGLLPMLKEPVKLVQSTNKKDLLFYQYVKKSTDSTMIRGALVGAGWEIKKQLTYSFRYDSELDSEPEIFLDNDGDTHILVFDKYTNYRISSDLTLNTIPFSEEEIVSEIFTFGKVKIKTMRVFQNAECNCIQAEGLYVDGTPKTNKGIYSIAFPLGRKNQLAPRFIPFGAEMIRNFKKNFSATEETVQNSLQLEDIIYSDSGSFAILRLGVGSPQRSLVTRPEDDPSVKPFKQTLASARAWEMVLPSPQPTTSTQRRSRATPPGDKYNNASPVQGVLPQKQTQLFSRSNAQNAPKFVCIKLEKEQGFEWYTSRSRDLFTDSYAQYNRLFLAGNTEKQELAFILYQADAAEEAYPVFVTLQNGKQLTEKLPQKKLVFSPIQFLLNNQYGSLYLNTETGEGGLMMVTTK